MTDSRIETDLSVNIIDAVVTALEQDNTITIHQLLENLEAKEIAHVLESVPYHVRFDLWQYVPEPLSGDVLVELGEVARLSLATHLQQSEVIDAISSLDSNDLAEVIESLPDDLSTAIRESLDYNGLKDLEATLSFPEDSAGRLMRTEIAAIRSDITLETVLRYLRGKKEIPDHTTGLMVIDRENHFLGELSLSTLLTSDPAIKVSSVMNDDTIAISPEMSQHDLSLLFQEHELVSVPVVDSDNVLIGRVTLDYMVDIMNEEADHQILGAVGLDEDEDLFSPILPSAKRRLFWLGMNLATAFLAAWVIGLFEATLDQIVALAVLMPVVASMGGIAGSQTLTLMIRGLATGKISSTNAKWLARKEISISIISGLVWAIAVGAVSYLWFDDVRISLVLGSAMTLNLLVAAVSGFFIPVLMRKMAIDPALAGGVVLTTVTDVVGFTSFLGLATIFLT